MFDVTVTLELARGHTAGTAGLNPAVLGDHKYTIEARTERSAVERALLDFRHAVRIGDRDAVEVSAMAIQHRRPGFKRKDIN
jgi:hypothetical protein